MKRLLYVFGLLFLNLNAFALDFELENVDQEFVSYSQIKGEKATVLDFWATYCGPCVRSIPELVKLQADFKNKGVQIIGINVDGPRNQSKVKPFIESFDVNYPVLLDLNREVMGLFNVNAMPSLLILNAEDDVVFSHEGFRAGDEIEIREQLEKLIGH